MAKSISPPLLAYKATDAFHKPKCAFLVVNKILLSFKMMCVPRKTHLEARNTSPAPAARIDPDKIPNLAELSSSGETKERPETNKDMVKPMPPNMPAPMMCDHPTSAGSTAIPVLTAKKEKRTMPTGFPSKRPRVIPKVRG